MNQDEEKIEFLRQFDAAIVVTSDTCYKDPSKDKSSQYISDRLEQTFSRVYKLYVPDDREAIECCISKLIDHDDVAIIITIGGTGLSSRDVTPESTKRFYEKDCPGIVAALNYGSLKYTKHAALSRLSAGIARKRLIVNFPGSPKACLECFEILDPILEHAIEQIRMDVIPGVQTHQQSTITPELNSTVAVEMATDSQSIPQTDDSCHETSESLSSSPRTQESQQPSEDELDSSLPQKDTSDLVLVVHKNESPYAMVDYSEAVKSMEHASVELKPSSEVVSIETATDAVKVLGKILSENIYSKTIIPPCPVSTMDGYVVNVPEKVSESKQDFKSIGATIVDSKERFEEMQTENQDGFFCYQVNTGGALPRKNFAVVPFESTGKPELTRFGTKTVVIYKLRVNSFIRQSGSDIDTSDLIAQGTKLGPVEVSLLQSMGHAKIPVFRMPSIGIVTSGDELTQTIDTLDRGQVFDSNGSLLSALFLSYGYRVNNHGSVKDNPESIKAKISEALDANEIVVITGGASMGTKDYVKDVLNSFEGARMLFGRVNIKPGKPAGLYSIKTISGTKFVFTLPGNPVSAYVTSLVLVLPFAKSSVDRYLNRSIECDVTKRSIRVKVAKLLENDTNQVYKFDSRLEFIRANLVPSSIGNGELLVEVSIKQQSSRLMSLKSHNCLLIRKPEMDGERLKVGQVYQAITLWNNFEIPTDLRSY